MMADCDNGEPTLAGSVDLALCRELADLEKEKTLLEEREKLVKKKIEALWSRLYPQLVGRKAQHLEDGIRLQPKRSILVSKKKGISTEEAVEALRASDDLSWLIREDYQSGKLREHVAELDKAAQEAGDIPDTPSDLLPEELAPYFQVLEKTAVVVYGVKQKAKAIVAAEEKRKDEDRGERKAD